MDRVLASDFGPGGRVYRPRSVISPSDTMPSKQAKSKKSRPPKGRGVVGLSSIRIGFPDRFHVVHPHGSQYQLAPAAGNRAWQVMRGNSVYDPDFTGAGTTALAFTQAAALYYRYRVLSSRITVDFFNNGNYPLTATLLASVSNTPPSATNAIGARHMKEAVIAPGGLVAWHYTAKARTAAVFGVPEAQVMSEDDFAGLNTGNPNNVWYWHLVVANQFGVAAGSAVVTVRVEYDTMWSMPLDLAP